MAQNMSYIRSSQTQGENMFFKKQPPTVRALIEAEHYQVEVALLAANAEFERAKHHKAMLEERKLRLRSALADAMRGEVPNSLIKGD